MGFVLDYLDLYFNQPDHDPDVIVCGDFNIPSRLAVKPDVPGSRSTVSSKLTEDSGKDRRFAVTVHQPTSRSPASNEGRPANNYDHCAVSGGRLFRHGAWTQEFSAIILTIQSTAHVGPLSRRGLFQDAWRQCDVGSKDAHSAVERRRRHGRRGRGENSCFGRMSRKRIDSVAARGACIPIQVLSG